MKRDLMVRLLFALVNLQLKATFKHLKRGSWGNNDMMTEECTSTKKKPVVVI